MLYILYVVKSRDFIYLIWCIHGHDNILYQYNYLFYNIYFNSLYIFI